MVGLGWFLSAGRYVGNGATAGRSGEVFEEPSCPNSWPPLSRPVRAYPRFTAVLRPVDDGFPYCEVGRGVELRCVETYLNNYPKR
jgi:hypothetical protein